MNTKDKDPQAAKPPIETLRELCKPHLKLCRRRDAGAGLRFRTAKGVLTAGGGLDPVVCRIKGGLARVTGV